ILLNSRKRPVTDLLKKERAPFKWDATAQLDFDNMKQAITTTLAFFIKGFAWQVLSRSAYEKEVMALDVTAQLAFDNLKQAMTTSPVLALPNFTQQFTIE
ncbi:hypothetical protein V2J09_020986, partial [Rumex salicifolius]